MEVIEKLPTTIEERLEIDEVVRFPASWHEFYALPTDCQYRLELGCSESHKKFSQF